MCSSFGSPGLPSVPRGLCALPKFVCLSLSLFAPRAAVCTARVVCPSGICMACHTWAPLCARRVVCAGEVNMSPHSQFPEPAVQLGHSLWAVIGLRSAAFSVSGPVSPCLLWETPHLLGPACKGASLCTETPPVSGLPPSFGAKGPAQNFSVFPLFRSPSSLLPLFTLLRLLTWRPGVFCCHQEVAL